MFGVLFNDRVYVKFLKLLNFYRKSKKGSGYRLGSSEGKGYV